MYITILNLPAFPWADKFAENIGKIMFKHTTICNYFKMLETSIKY